ncbi:MAG: hypothetical protein WCT23_05635 [Candidatus Neomarinimicrobiota bacterium]
MAKIEESPVLLSWKVHLAKKNPSRAIAAAVLIIICVYFIFLTLQDPFLTLISFFILVMMVLPYYLPNTYILTEEGIIKKMILSKKSRNWKEFARYKVGKSAIQLYTLNKESRLDNYRSFLIICEKNKDEVLKIVEQKLKNSEKV